MMRFLVPALAAFALWAGPAAADCARCKDCPHHTTAQADGKDGKKDEKGATTACPCVGEGKECRCGAGCQCAHCAQHKHGEQPKKS
jgi:hypothetical protein